MRFLLLRTLRFTLYEVINYVLLYPLPVSYLTPKPQELSPLWSVFRPFSFGVWSAAFAGLILAILIHCMLTGDTMGQTVFTIYHIQMKQGKAGWWRFRPPAKVFLSFWFLYVFFILCAYECDLVAYLSKVDHEPPINDEADILAQGRKLYLPRGSIFVYLFSESPNRLQKVIFDEMVEKDHFMRFVRGYPTLEFENEMRRENRVIIANRLMRMAAYEETVKRHGREPFRLSGPKVALPDMPSGIVVAKNALYYPEFVRISEYLKAGGFIEKFTWDQIRGWRDESAEKQRDLKPFSLAHTFGGLILFISGIASSFVCLLFEKMNSGIDQSEIH